MIMAPGSLAAPLRSRDCFCLAAAGMAGGGHGRRGCSPATAVAGCSGPAALEPWAAGACGAGLSSLFVRLSPSADGVGAWIAWSPALLVPLAPVLKS
jgi:hypothetical protein